jgi:uncharacterized protein involved in oxidation of intracellular sulfur
MKVLFILNDPPYGTERCYNALRLASALVKKDPATEVTIFLMADAVSCGRKGQKTPDGYYSRHRTSSSSIGRCGTRGPATIICRQRSTA